jgi:hypothetical protein
LLIGKVKNKNKKVATQQVRAEAEHIHPWGVFVRPPDGMKGRKKVSPLFAALFRLAIRRQKQNHFSFNLSVATNPSNFK